MFVIFPADELILMTYGSAIPVVKPRPTLDCLREPLVPIGDRSYSPSEILARSTPTPSSSSIQALMSSSSNYGIPDATKQRLQQLKASNVKLTPKEEEMLGAVSYSSDENLLLSDYGDRQGRGRSPSVFLGAPSSAYSSRPTSPSSSKSGKSGQQSQTQSKSKFRPPKLHISLGRTKPDLTESKRTKEDHILQVDNPAFTSENIRERNFDAFFEAGQSVYKLHPKESSEILDDRGAMGYSSEADAEVPQKGDRCHKNIYYECTF
uniref:Uncharacterized protein n=1 Tax=Megaselia scalaris TaxID=36166 RepID=T1H3J6_MEGSC